jgi:glutamyl-tRNA reductase
MAGRLVYRLLQSALASGKLVRTRTAIARNHTSVVSVALDTARELLGGLGLYHVLVIGAGRIAELTLKHIRGDAPRSVGIANRTIERARELAHKYQAMAWPLDRLEDAIAQADIVVSCTAAPHVIVGANMIARALDGRARPLLLLDLAVPRDIDQQAAAIRGVRLFDIDDLQAVCEANRAARAAEVANAEALIEDKVAKFMEWWTAQQIVPTIRALRAHAEMIRTAELDRTLAKLPELSPRQQDAIAALSAAIVNKLLHQPIATLKDPNSGGQLAQAIRTLFHLSDAVRGSRATES